MKVYLMAAAVALWLTGCVSSSDKSRGGLRDTNFNASGYDSELQHGVDSPGTRDPRLPSTTDRDFPGRTGPGELKN